MGKELDAFWRVIKAIPISARDGAMKAAETSAKAKFALTFLKGLHDACRDVPKEDLAAAALGAR